MNNEETKTYLNIKAIILSVSLLTYLVIFKFLISIFDNNLKTSNEKGFFPYVRRLSYSLLGNLKLRKFYRAI